MSLFFRARRLRKSTLLIPAILLVSALGVQAQSELRPCKYDEKVRDYARCDFEEADLKGVDFAEADLRGARLDWANLTNADLSGADFRGPNPESGKVPDGDTLMYRVLIRAAAVIGARFQGALLQWAHFDISDVSETDFSYANMEGVTFEASTVNDANFKGAFLHNSLFTFADLSGSDFTGADLSGANFEGAIMEGVVLDGANLTKAISPEGLICSGKEEVPLDCPPLPEPWHWQLARPKYPRY